jgi:ribose-phosphate pyrophosphokinase
MKQLKIFSGIAEYPLAKQVAKGFNQELNKIEIKVFADGEERIQFQENVRGTNVFLIQPTNPPAENLMRLLMMIDAAKRASAHRITAVVPYFGYGRQDRKDRPRVPITAKLAARMIEEAGAHHLLTMDFHVNQLEGFFDIPVDHLYARKTMVEELRKLGDINIRAVAPDAGSVYRAKGYNQKLVGDGKIVYINKERNADNESEVVSIVGKIGPEYAALLVDDIIDTGGTIIHAAEALHRERGVEKFIVAIAHALLSKDAIEKLAASIISRIYITDTIPLSEDKLSRIETSGLKEKLTVVPVAPLFGYAISTIHSEEGSISSLFD